VVVAGLVAGLATLTRPVGVLFLLPLVLGVWTVRPRWSRRALLAPLLLAVCATGTVAPWTIRNLHTMRGFVPVSTQTGIALAGTYNDATDRDRIACTRCWPWGLSPADLDLVLRSGLDELEIDRTLRARALQYAARHPAYVARAAGWQTARMLGAGGIAFERMVVADAVAEGPDWARLAWLTLIGFWVTTASAAVGAFSRRARRTPRFVWLVPAAAFLAAALVLGTSRYRAPADPFLILLAACGAVALGDATRRLRSSAGAAERSEGP